LVLPKAIVCARTSKHRDLYVVVPEKLSKSLFFESEIVGVRGILCKEVMDDRPKPCNFGLGMEAL